MSRQGGQSKGDNPSAAAEWKDVKLSVYLSVQVLTSSSEYVRRWTEEDQSGPN